MDTPPDEEFDEDYEEQHARDMEAAALVKTALSDVMQDQVITTEFFLELIASLYLFLRMTLTTEEAAFAVGRVIRACEDWIDKEETSLLVIDGQEYDIPYTPYEAGGLERMQTTALELHALLNGES